MPLVQFTENLQFTDTIEFSDVGIIFQFISWNSYKFICKHYVLFI